MTDQNEYARFVPLSVWPPNLGNDPRATVTTTPVPRPVYEFVKAPGGSPHLTAPLTSPFASREDELASIHPTD